VRIRLKVDLLEDPCTGTLIHYVLVDEEGRIVFRFGLVDECQRAIIAEDQRKLYCVHPDDLGVKTGQWVTLEVPD